MGNGYAAVAAANPFGFVAMRSRGVKYYWAGLCLRGPRQHVRGADRSRFPSSRRSLRRRCRCRTSRSRTSGSLCFASRSCTRLHRFPRSRNRMRRRRRLRTRTHEQAGRPARRCVVGPRRQRHPLTDRERDVCRRPQADRSIRDGSRRERKHRNADRASFRRHAAPTTAAPATPTTPADPTTRGAGDRRRQRTVSGNAGADLHDSVGIDDRRRRDDTGMTRTHFSSTASATRPPNRARRPTRRARHRHRRSAPPTPARSIRRSRRRAHNHRPAPTRQAAPGRPTISDAGTTSTNTTSISGTTAATAARHLASGATNDGSTSATTGATSGTEPAPAARDGSTTNSSTGSTSADSSSTTVSTGTAETPNRSPAPRAAPRRPQDPVSSLPPAAGHERGRESDRDVRCGCGIEQPHRDDLAALERVSAWRTT